MKINVEIDCTPEEARALGYDHPNVQTMQEKLLRELEERMSAGLQAVDPQELMRQWLAPNLERFEQMLEAFQRMGGRK